MIMTHQITRLFGSQLTHRDTRGVFTNMQQHIAIITFLIEVMLLSSGCFLLSVKCFKSCSKSTADASHSYPGGGANLVALMRQPLGFRELFVSFFRVNRDSQQIVYWSFLEYDREEVAWLMSYCFGRRQLELCLCVSKISQSFFHGLSWKAYFL